MIHTYKMPNTMRMVTDNRRLSMLEMPVGDAFAGPAYGEKLKGGGGLGSIIGVVAAVAAVSTGVGMLAGASMFGGAGISALTGLAGGAMVAGGVMQGVGAITGDRKLSQLGGTLTMIGGVSSLAADYMADKALGTTLSEGSKAGMEKVRNAFGSSAEVVQGQQATIGQAPTVAAPATSSAPNISLETDWAKQGAADEAWLNDGVAGSVPETAAPIQTAGTQTTAQTDWAKQGAADEKWLTSGMEGSATKPTESKGLLEKLLVSKDGGISTGAGIMGGQVLSGIGQGMAAEKNYDLQKQQQEFNQGIINQQMKNANSIVAIIDPNDPQRAYKEQMAKANGRPIQYLGYSKPATATNISYNMMPNATR